MKTSSQEPNSASCRPEAVRSLRDGDIYFWKYKVEKNLGQYGDYHCKSQIAIVKNGRYIDTYWSDMTSDCVIDPDKCILTYKGNESEMTTVSEYDKQYYRPEDLVDMRHANHGRAPIYLRPGATRDKDRVLEHLKARRERREHDISYAQDELVRIDNQIKAAELGLLDQVTL